MYLINLRLHTASLDRVDDALDAHRAFLTQQFEAGVFVARRTESAARRRHHSGGAIEREQLDGISPRPVRRTEAGALRGDGVQGDALAPGLNLPIRLDAKLLTEMKTASRPTMAPVLNNRASVEQQLEVVHPRRRPAVTRE